MQEQIILFVQFPILYLSIIDIRHQMEEVFQLRLR